MSRTVDRLRVSETLLQSLIGEIIQGVLVLEDYTPKVSGPICEEIVIAQKA